MYRLYLDLREKLGEPQWHDEHGVPRYCTYHPEHGGIYDRWAALLEIRCQGCGLLFPVSSSFSTTDLIRPLLNRPDVPVPDTPELPTATNDGGAFSFGDAPWHGRDQCAGTTMTTDTMRVLEFWIREHHEWVRRPEREFDYGALRDHENDQL